MMALFFLEIEQFAHGVTIIDDLSNQAHCQVILAASIPINAKVKLDTKLSTGGRCLGKWFRIDKIKSSVIHGISTFLLLCYSHCIRVSLNLLTHALYLQEIKAISMSP